jgi:protein SCO1/2
MRVRLALALLMLLAIASSAGAEGARWGKGYVPNVPVVTQDGRSVRFYDDVLKGKIAVISFIYTSCRDICPLVTARLSQVEDKLGDVVGRDVFFVSISIDPDTDTPEKLKEFAAAFGVGEPGWSFLTGKRQDIDLIRHKLGERSSKLAAHRNEILLFNDATGEWERASAFGDLDVLAMTVRAMEPGWRSQMGKIERGGPDKAAGASAVELPGQALFVKACAACHTIGRGDKVGPDLNGLTARRDRAWITRYVTAPDRMRSDPIALALSARYGAVRMPNLGLSESDASDVIGYVEAKSYAVAADAKKSQTQPRHRH